MEKKIKILWDYTNEQTLSYMEVLKEIEKETPLIITNCLDFFSFGTLNKSYDVEVVKQNGDYILLSELLEDTENLYTRKIIRKAHDARRLLIADHFQFKKQTS